MNGFSHKSILKVISNIVDTQTKSDIFLVNVQAYHLRNRKNG